MTLRALVVSAALCYAMGCESPTPDANPQVFQNSAQVAAARQVQLRKIWQESAIDVLREDRPDLAAISKDPFVIVVEADDIRQVIDLSPVEESLSARPGKSQLILREFLTTQLGPFDQARLASLSLYGVTPDIFPMLVSEKQLEAHSVRASAGERLHATTLATGLYWIPMVRRRGVDLPISTKVIDAWQTTSSRVDQIALDNLLLPADPMETTSFSTLGRVGALKASVNPNVLLCADFLKRVRSEWGTNGDLAILMASPTDVRFVESSDKKLLDALYPQWEREVDFLEDPLARRPLLLSDSGLGLMAYDPPVRIRRATSLPTTNPMQKYQDPTTTRPALPKTTPYIAR
jgi:hypothetical protein